jgi:hypothetical protein
MAKTADQVRQEDFMKRAQSLRLDVDKMIAREKFVVKENGKTLAQHAQDYQNELGKLQEQIMADKAKDFQASLNDAFTDAITYGTGAVRINPSTLSGDTVPGITHAQWLDQTQNMRVVALNEACGIAKAMIEDSNGVTPEYIAKMAHTFATFLTEGRA